MASFIRLAIQQRGSLVPFRARLLPTDLHVTHYDLCLVHEALRGRRHWRGGSGLDH